MNFLIQCDTVNGCGNVYPGDITHCPKCGTSQAFSSPAAVNPRDYVYDIETYPNVFTCRFVHLATDTRWSFEISDRVNQCAEFVQFVQALASCRARMVGYNNIHFDYPVAHYILGNPWVVAGDIYEKAQAIFNADDYFAHNVWDRDRIVEQIDLFKIWHFDNKNRRTSLKALEIAMRMQQVEDLPFPPGTRLNADQIDTLHVYNDHDCTATALFYARSVTAINLRETLGQSLGLNVMNDSDVKMGEKILVAEMEKAGISCYERSPVTGKRVKRQTYRHHIDLSEAVFPYVRFERPEFHMVHQWMIRQSITETKGVFNDIDVTPEMLRYMNPELVYVHGFAKRRTKLSKVPADADLSGCNMTAENLHCVVDGLTYYFGTGGIHASIESQIVISTDEMVIVDVDVASFYPNLGIKNRLYPAHLGTEFGDAYLGVYNTRKTYDKTRPENGAFKLALNGAYGGSNNEHSPFLDPLYTMQITTNGQLLLCMLTEQLLKVPGLSMIQANTDGVTFYAPRKYLNHCRAVCRWWEEFTLLELEEVLYSRMFIRDVNNYMAEKMEGGKIKRIGAYAHERQDVNPATRESVYNKDPSALIVPMTAEAVLVRGADLEDFIKSHTDKFDFMIRAKVPRSDRLVMRWPEYPGVEIEQQKTGRYYISRNGGTLIKISDPKGPAGCWKRKNGITDQFFNAVMVEINGQPGDLDSSGTPHDERIHTKNKSTYAAVETGLSVGWRVTMCNNADDFDFKTLNYDYYIEEARKLIDALTEPSV